MLFNKTGKKNLRTEYSKLLEFMSPATAKFMEKWIIDNIGNNVMLLLLGIKKDPDKDENNFEVTFEYLNQGNDWMTCTVTYRYKKWGLQSELKPEVKKN